MELESRSDTLILSLPRERAEALVDVADIGLRIVEGLELVQRPAATEHAINELRKQVLKGRGKTVTSMLTRGDGSLIEKAVWVALKTLQALSMEKADGAQEALGALRQAIAAVDTPNPANLVVRRRRR